MKFKSSNHRFVIGKSTKPNFVQVDVSFDYNGYPVKYYIYLKKGNLSNQEYLEEAKRIYIEREKSGFIDDYARKYITKIYSSKRAITITALAATSALAIAGVATSVYFKLNGTNIDSLCRVNFDLGGGAINDTHIAGKTYKKGTTWAEVKKDAPKAEDIKYQYHTFDKWTLNGEAIADDYQFKEDTNLKANYNLGKVKITIDAVDTTKGGFIDEGGVRQRYKSLEVEYGTPWSSVYEQSKFDLDTIKYFARFKNNQGTQIGDDYLITNDETFTTVYLNREETFNIVFRSSVGQVPYKELYTGGSSWKFINNSGKYDIDASNLGYKFKCYKSEATGLDVDSSFVVAKNDVFTAQFEDSLPTEGEGREAVDEHAFANDSWFVFSQACDKGYEDLKKIYPKTYGYKSYNTFVIKDSSDATEVSLKTRKVVLNNIKYDVTVIGEGEDYIRSTVDDKYKATLTFQFKEVVKDAPFGPDTNLSYKTSNIRTILNNEIFNNVENYVKENIAPVYKKTFVKMVDEEPISEAIQEKMFVLSPTEMGYVNSTKPGYYPEGMKVCDDGLLGTNKYYSSFGNTWDKGVSSDKYKKSSKNYWLRSPDTDIVGNPFVWGVNRDGGLGEWNEDLQNYLPFASEDTLGVCPSFALGAKKVPIKFVSDITEVDYAVNGLDRDICVLGAFDNNDAYTISNIKATNNYILPTNQSDVTITYNSTPITPITDFSWSVNPSTNVGTIVINSIPDYVDDQQIEIKITTSKKPETHLMENR